jgi:integrase
MWKTKVYQGARKTTYYVRWVVAGKEWKEPFANSALAESFRSDLTSAARRGEAFIIATGRPVSMSRIDHTEKWYDHACAFVDMKWPDVAATTRRTHAEAMTAATMLLFASTRGMPELRLMRTALRVWAFNTVKRVDPDMPDEIRSTLAWVRRNSRPVSVLADPEVLRPTISGIGQKIDGDPLAASVAARRRKIFSTSLEYGVERKLLASNPIRSLKKTNVSRKLSGSVDRRVVANPLQVGTLLDGVRKQGRIGPRMVAYYACLYYAGLRPEEGIPLALPNLVDLPATGWGSMTFDSAEPHAGKHWTNSGENRDSRHLKQRVRGESRTVPIPPPLTDLLNAHINTFGTGTGGRLFISERNKSELPVGTIHRIWRWTRGYVFTDEVAASPLAGTPYDLRHAAVSTWLNGGVPATQVAEWAGQSIEILLRIYAKCLDGEQATMRRRVGDALGLAADTPGAPGKLRRGQAVNLAAYLPRTAVEGR